LLALGAAIITVLIKFARGVLPGLRTDDPSRDATDEALIQQINAALAARRT
jgi:hypothetical protein